MFAWFTLHIAALVVTAAVFGGMLFFMALFAPLVFRNLDKDAASAFMRRLFPVYYTVLAVAAVLPALLLLPGGTYGVEVAVMIAVAAGFVLGGRVLTPMLDRSRGPGDEPRFRLVHRTSVLINLIQFVAVTVVLVRLAQ